MNTPQFEYDVALSFAGEDRGYVEQVADCLKQHHIKVYYDEYDVVEMWGKNLYVHLDEVYRQRSRFCIIFISQYYKNKLWTNHERESAQARAFMEKGEYILPVRFDNTEIPGIRPTIGYIDGNKFKPLALCQFIIRKLSSTKGQSDEIDIRQPVISFLKDVEERFKYTKFFHTQQKIVLEDQYIPIEVSYESKERQKEESNSEASLKQAHAEKDSGFIDKTNVIHETWEELRKKAHRRLIVLAEPGMGKSTLLQMEAGRIARTEWRKLMENNISLEKTIFPIFLKLSDLAKSDQEIFDVLRTLLKYDYHNTVEGFLNLLERKLQAGQCVFLLDALDEVPHADRQILAERLNRFARNFSQCTFICTSRKDGYGGAFLDEAQKVEIAPFKNQQVENYIQVWFNNVANTLKDPSISAEALLLALRGQPQIYELTQIPLLLSLACSLYQEKALILPARPGQIYQKTLDYMLREWRGQRKIQDETIIEVKKMLLEKMAYEFSCKEINAFSLNMLFQWIEAYLKSGDAPSDLKHFTSSSLIRELCEQDGILSKTGKESEQYIFWHYTFQEYLAVAYLKRLIDQDSSQGLEVVKSYFWDYTWHERLILLASIMEQPEILLRAILDEKDDIFSSMFVLAGRCAAECGERNSDLFANILERILSWWFSDPLDDFRIYSIVKLANSNARVFQTVLSWVESEKPKVRQGVAIVLGKIRKEMAVEPLCRLLKDELLQVRINAVKTIKKIGLKSVASVLHQTLLDLEAYPYEDESKRTLRDLLIYTLISFDRDAAINAVTDLLYYTDRNPKDIDNQSRLNQYPDDDSHISEEAIGKRVYGVKDASDLEKSDMHFASRKNAARTLLDLGTPQAIHILIRALVAEMVQTRLATAEVLNDDLLWEFSQMGKKFFPSNPFSSKIALHEKLLIEIVDQEIKLKFRKAVLDKYLAVGRVAIWILGKLGGRDALFEFILCAIHGKSEVRIDAYKALIPIVHSGLTRSIEQATDALDNANLNIRNAATKFFGTLNDERALNGIVKALNDEHPSIRWAAIIAILEFDENLNIDNLEDLTDALRRLIAINCSGDCFFAPNTWVFKKITNPPIVDALLKLLDHDDVSIRLYAALALHRFDNHAGIDLVFKALKSNDSHVRIIAVKILKFVRNEHAIEALKNALTDEETVVRENAIRALNEIDQQIAEDKLLEALGSANPDVRANAINTLAGSNGYKYIDQLIQALNDVEEVKKTALKALGKIGNYKVVKPLIKIFENEYKESSYSSRKYLLKALNNCVSNDTIISVISKTHFQRFEDDLISFLKDDDVGIRRIAIDLLKRVATTRAVEPLIEIFKTPNNKNLNIGDLIDILKNFSGSEVINCFVQFTRDGKNSFYRGEALRALAKLDLQKTLEVAIEVLEKGTIEFERDLRDSAIKILKNFDKERAKKALLKTLSKMSEFEIHNLDPSLEVPPASVDHYISYLSSPQRDIFIFAVDEISARGKLDALEKIIQHPDIDIYHPEIFPVVRALNFRFGKKRSELFPVYQEVIERFKRPRR